MASRRVIAACASPSPGAASGSSRERFGSWSTLRVNGADRRRCFHRGRMLEQRLLTPIYPPTHLTGGRFSSSGFRHSVCEYIELLRGGRGRRPGGNEVLRVRTCIRMIL